MDFESLSDKELWDLTSDESTEVRMFALYQIVSRLYQAAKYSDLISPADAALGLAESQEDFTLQVELGVTLGRVYMELNRAEEALPKLLQATDVARIHSSEPVLADAIRTLATCQQKLDLDDEAESNLRAAAAIYASNSMATPAGISLLDLGEMLGSQDRQVEALDIFSDALSTFQGVGDLIGSGRAYDRIAACQIDLGRIDKAIGNLREAHNIFLYLADENRLAWAQYRLGWTLTTYGEYAEAIPLLLAASAAYKSMRRFVNAANADTQLAHAYFEIGREEEALELYEIVRSVFQGAGEITDALIADVNSARRLRFGDNEKAIEKLQRVIDTGNAQENSWIVRAASLRLAECFLDRDTIDDAQSALNILEKVDIDDYGDNKPDQAKHLMIMAKALFEVNRRDEALFYARQITAFGMGAGFQFESATAYELLAMSAQDAGQVDEANRLYSQSIALFLAAGFVDVAVRLSNRFLPENQGQVSNMLANPSVQTTDESHSEGTVTSTE